MGLYSDCAAVLEQQSIPRFQKMQNRSSNKTLSTPYGKELLQLRREYRERLLQFKNERLLCGLDEEAFVTSILRRSRLKPLLQPKKSGMKDEVKNRDLLPHQNLPFWFRRAVATRRMAAELSLLCCFFLMSRFSVPAHFSNQVVPSVVH